MRNIVDFNKHLTSASQYFQIEWMDREDATLLHYTSGSTGKPKGILLVQEAMVQQLQTTRWVLDLNDEDIFWCTADPGWVTGTVYGFSVRCLQGLQFLSLEEDFHQKLVCAIEEYGVTVWYSAPTAFRMLMGAGEGQLRRFDLSFTTSYSVRR